MGSFLPTTTGEIPGKFIRMSWLLGVLILGFTFCSNFSEATHDPKRLPFAMVPGTVYCDTCFQHAAFSKNSHFISGASVAVECRDWDNTKQHFYEVAKTDDLRQFKTHLPFSVAKHAKKIADCSVKLLSSSEPCSVASPTSSTSSFKLKSTKAGSHIFSAGFLTFRPKKLPVLCNPSPRNLNSIKQTQISNIPELPGIQIPPILGNHQQPPIFVGNLLPPRGFLLPPLPPLPNLPPLPGLPPLPRLPGFPRLPPLKTQLSKSSEKLIPDAILPPLISPSPGPSSGGPRNPLNPPSLRPLSPLLPPIPTLPIPELSPPPSPPTIGLPPPTPGTPPATMESPASP